MEFQPDWNVTFPEALQQFNTLANPFQVPISTHFRNSAKVVKSGSRNNSPRRLGRRKTTSIPASRTQPVLDNHRASLPQWPYQTGGRPSSWHHNTYNESNIAMNDVHHQPIMTPNNFTTTTVNGLVTPITYPLMDEPQIQELITPLEELSAGQVEYGYQQHYDNGGQSWFLQKPGQDLVNGGFPSDPSSQQFWHLTGQTSAPANVPTAPSSPNFLPIQSNHESSPFMLDISSLDMQPDGEELVGMGLYDSPAEVQSSEVFSGEVIFTTGRRKSLKLEDSFEPVTETSDAEQEETQSLNDDDVDDESEDEDEDEVTVEDEDSGNDDHGIGNLIIQTNNPNEMNSYYAEQYSNTDPVGNLSGQTFYFDNDIFSDHVPTTSEDFMSSTHYMNNHSYMVPSTTPYPTNQGIYGWI